MTEESAATVPPITDPEAMQDPVQVLEEIARLMGYEVSVQAEEGDDHLLLNMTGETSADLIGMKGQTLDALQYLVNKIVGRERANDRPVVVDCGGYRERRTQALTELAHVLSDKAVRLGSTIAVNPMSAHDRRIIHMALREVEGVSTRSEGDGDNRRLLIVPQP